MLYMTSHLRGITCAIGKKTQSLLGSFFLVQLNHLFEKNGTESLHLKNVQVWKLRQ